MGLVSSHLNLLAIEQAKHPIKGDVLVLGQQGIWATLEDTKNIFTSHSIKSKSLKEGFDTKNKIPTWVGTPRGEFTNVQTTFSLLGADKVFVADVSDYENPDYLIDLNHDVDEKYYEKFDVVFDSGTLEHVFDAPTALGNYVKMVKKGGRVMLILPCSNTINHGFYSFNPHLFFDFFSANGFSDFSCYLVERNDFNFYKKSKIYRYNYLSATDKYTLSSKHMVDVCFCATKNKDSDFKKINKPVQGVYTTFTWLNKGNDKPISGKSGALESVKNLIKRVEFATKKFRPSFIDALCKTKWHKKNLTYLGKF